MKTATIEILEEGETIFGSRTAGEYFVREYEDNERSRSPSKRISTIQLDCWCSSIGRAVAL